MTIAGLVVLADGYLGIAKYLNENRDIFKEFLDCQTEASQVEEFAMIYLADYNELHSIAMERKKFLSSFSTGMNDKNTPYLVENNVFIPSIETTGRESGVVGSNDINYIQPTGMEDAKPPDEEHF